MLVFVALGILFYAPVLSGVRTFPDGDFTHHFLPFSLFQQQEMLAGRLPVWNPYTYGGHPFLADVQAAVFYPISTLLLAATLPWQEAGARLYLLQIEAVLQVILAGIFTFVLPRQLTGSFWAGLLAGVSFAFSGYLTGYPPAQLAVLRTAIWLPLLLWLLLRMAAEPRRWRWWMATGVASRRGLSGGPLTDVSLLGVYGCSLGYPAVCPALALIGGARTAVCWRRLSCWPGCWLWDSAQHSCCPAPSLPG